MINLQYKTFWCQNILSSVIYISSLIAIEVLVSFFPSFAYDPDINLPNKEFNIMVITTIVMGVLSLAFSWNPSWIRWARSLTKMGKKLVNMLDDMEKGTNY